MKWFKKRQSTYCFCPICHQDLVHTESFISDTDYVHYRCSKCGCESKWDFDFPAPMLIKYQHLNNRLTKTD